MILIAESGADMNTWTVFPMFRWAIFKKNKLKPWKVKGWVIPPEKSSEFVANMEHVLDVYKRPLNKDFPVVCLDESPEQFIEEAIASTPITPGYKKRQDYQYIWHGVVNVFMANEPPMEAA